MTLRMRFGKFEKLRRLEKERLSENLEGVNAIGGDLGSSKIIHRTIQINQPQH